ncbi:PadR family transcriptional regulator [Kribbella sp. ALI-6-A]|uniref:PadR family transcriptional regulator n=1 Tax=Kribbella sp. ALI-6-A TaxID=1933817 RepID=UPI00097C7E7B|nr:PadR family transcriptional regulator [Kribbella sp. ALI-6-A]ONI66831.1 PadR family transcriptional regulator [Kribbella sp. ALI-6-A]
MVLQRIILGMLAIAPMSGYDLKRHFDSTVNYFWSADKAQVYRTLAALVTEGLVEVRKVPGTAGPDRQEHHLTAAGRARLHDWLVSDLDRQPERNAFLARVFFAGELDSEELTALLERQREAARTTLATLKAVRKSTPEPTDRAERLRLATLDNGLRHARAELAWLDALEKELA